MSSTLNSMMLVALAMLPSTGAAFVLSAVRTVALVHIAEPPCLTRTSWIPYRPVPVAMATPFIYPTWAHVENLGSAADILMFMWAGALRSPPQRPTTRVLCSRSFVTLCGLGLMTFLLHLAVWVSWEMSEMATPDVSKLDAACDAHTKLCDKYVDLVKDVERRDVTEIIKMSKMYLTKACLLADKELKGKGLPTGPSPPISP